MTEIEKKVQELKKIINESGIQAGDEIAMLEDKLSSRSKTDSVWKNVELARHPDRPYALDYIKRIFDNFIELHGDRAFGDDAAIVGGIAFLDSRPVTIIANQKGRTLKENVMRNYGMAHPEGYRKALRLAKEAEIFSRPIITIIDTPGAYPGLESEERCIGESIARNLREFSQLLTPVINIVIGEGGSGGALGIGVGDKVFMLENAIYSVISPEGCASILLRDTSKAKEAAEMLRITPKDLIDFNIIDGIIPEPQGGAHTDPDWTSMKIKEMLIRELNDICEKDTEELVCRRNNKIRAVGQWNER